MFFIDLLFALVIAIALSLILTGIFGWRHPRDESMAGNLIFVFLMFFLFAWAGGVWMTPWGPALWGGYWAPFLFPGIFILLLLIALIPPRQPLSRQEAVEQAEKEAVAGTALGIFFWVLIIGLVASILFHYI